MQAFILKCDPNSQFHFGRIAMDADDKTSLNATTYIPHSDTLFSAIISILANMMPETELQRYLQLFGYGADKAALKISSGFYCLQKEATDNSKKETVYFLPTPVHYGKQASADNHKLFKSISFISKGVWEQGLLFTDWKSQCVSIGNKFVCLAEEAAMLFPNAHEKVKDKATKVIDKKIYSYSDLPKVKVHSRTQDATLYSHTNVLVHSIADDDPKLKTKDEPLNKIPVAAHFYFLIDGLNDIEIPFRHNIMAAINLLADNGIGGERSVGCGQLAGIEFVEEINFSLKEGLNSNFAATLSLFNPMNEEELAAMYQYKVITRGGRQTAKDGKLKRLKMIAEGGIVKSEAAIHGRICDITPKETNGSTYLRSGIALTIPVVAV